MPHLWLVSRICDTSTGVRTAYMEPEGAMMTHQPRPVATSSAAKGLASWLLSYSCTGVPSVGTATRVGAEVHIRSVPGTQQ